MNVIRRIMESFSKEEVDWVEKNGIRVPNPLYTIHEGERLSFECHVCGRESWHPMDVEHGYCGYCHVQWGMWKSFPDLDEVWWDLLIEQIQRVRGREGFEQKTEPISKNAETFG